MSKYTREEVIKLIVNRYLNDKYTMKQSLALMFKWIYATHSNHKKLTKKKCVQYTLNRQESFKKWLKDQSYLKLYNYENI